MTRTNDMIASIKAQVNELIDYANADADHSYEMEYHEQAANDRHRALTLTKIISLLDEINH